MVVWFGVGMVGIVFLLCFSSGIVLLFWVGCVICVGLVGNCLMFVGICCGLCGVWLGWCGVLCGVVVAVCVLCIVCDMV